MLAEKERAIVGRTTFTTLASIGPRIDPSITAARIARRRDGSGMPGSGLRNAPRDDHP
jgi:hypothetical protein